MDYKLRVFGHEENKEDVVTGSSRVRLGLHDHVHSRCGRLCRHGKVESAIGGLERILDKYLTYNNNTI